jgi:hypothetical protein
MMARNFFHMYRPHSCGFPEPEARPGRVPWRHVAAALAIALAIPAQAQVNPQANQQLRQAVDRFMTAHVEKMKARLGPKTRVEYTVA